MVALIEVADMHVWSLVRIASPFPAGTMGRKLCLQLSNSQ